MYCHLNIKLNIPWSDNWEMFPKSCSLDTPEMIGITSETFYTKNIRCEILLENMVNESAALASCFVLYDLCFSGLWSKPHRVFPAGQALTTSVLILPQVLLTSVPQHPLYPWAGQGTSKVTARCRTTLHPRAGKLWDKGEEEGRSGIHVYFTVWHHLSCTELHWCQGAGLARRRKENC